MCSLGIIAHRFFFIFITVVLVKFAVVNFSGCKVRSNCGFDGIFTALNLGVSYYNILPLELSFFPRAKERRRGKRRSGAPTLCTYTIPSSFFPIYEHRVSYTEAGFAF